MRTAIFLLLLSGLYGCGTPQGVTDTASLVAKMTTQLNGHMNDYVDGLNAVRADDARRLTEMHARTELLARTNADQFSNLELSGDQDASKLVKAIQGSAAASLDIGTESAYLRQLQADFGEASFDGSALMDISTIAGAIARPSATTDEVKALGTFGQQVYKDMKSGESAGKK